MLETKINVSRRRKQQHSVQWHVLADVDPVSPSILQEVHCSNFGNGLRAALHVKLATDIEDVFFRRVDT